MSNYKTVFFTLGVLLIVLGFSMLVPITIQLIYSEFNSTFIISSIITITFGALFFLANIDPVSYTHLTLPTTVDV